MKLYTIESSGLLLPDGEIHVIVLADANGQHCAAIAYPYAPCGESGPFFHGLICTRPAGHTGRHGFTRDGNEYGWS